MKSLLIICDLSHCSHRIPGLSEELVKNGWEVHVISPAMSNRQRRFIGIDPLKSWSLHETKNFKMTYDRFSHIGNTFQWLYRVYVEKKTRAFNGRLYARPRLSTIEEIPDFAIEEHSRWIPIAFNRARKLMDENNVDIVMSSSSPFSSHLVAREVSKVYGIPWVADYRDLWSLNHARLGEPNPLQEKFESHLLDSASAATTVTAGLASELKSLFPGPISVVHNAFNSMTTTWKTTFSLPLVISYTGSIYEGFQNYGTILKVLEQINKDNVYATITFVGPSIHFISDYYKSQRRDVPSFVNLMNAVDRDLAHKIQRDADLLLVLNWDDPNQKGVESTKLFEYLGAGVPILSTGGFGGDAIERILKETSTGFYAHDELETYNYIERILQDLKQGYIRNNVAVGKYSIKNQAIVLREALERII